MQAPNSGKQALWRDFKQVLLRTQFIPSSATSSKQHLVLLSFFFLLAKTGSAGLQRQNILMCLWPATCCFVCFYVVFVPHCHLGLGRGVCCGRLFVVFWRCHMWRRVCCGQLLSLWPFSTWPTLITPCPGSRENWHCFEHCFVHIMFFNLHCFTLCDIVLYI